MDSAIRISGVVEESIVDGDGIRFVVFTQGCPHRCAGCHNPDTHDFGTGKVIQVDALWKEIRENPLLSGVTFSGGEPFCQPGPLALLGKKARAAGLSVTTYTGYRLEELQAMHSPSVAALLGQTDILIDGKFMLEKRDLSLKFRGSSNQRIIDMNATRLTGQITPASL